LYEKLSYAMYMHNLKYRFMEESLGEDLTKYYGNASFAHETPAQVAA
jgi:hypothetical protein